MARTFWMGILAGGAILLTSMQGHAQRFGGAVLNPGFAPDPMVFQGVSGGPVSAQMLGPTCRGWIDNTPSHVVRVNGFLPFLRVWVNSTGDTTLVVRAPNGQVTCADDTYGINPGLDFRNAMPGAYQVYVGSYASGPTFNYQIGLSESMGSTPTSPAGMAVMAPPPPVVGGGMGVNVNAGIMAAPPPVVGGGMGVNIGGGGSVMAAPPPVVAGGMTAPPPVVGAGGMIVGGPSNGNFRPPPGFGPIRLATGFLPDPTEVGGMSGGAISANTVNPVCRGFIDARPQHLLVLTTSFGFLRIYAHSAGDTTLMVRAPTGQVFCADDTWGHDPGVDLNGATPGTYQVYVGSYSAGQTFPYQLGLSELRSTTSTGGMQ